MLNLKAGRSPVVETKVANLFLVLFATLGGAHLMSQILWQFKSGQKNKIG
ncbi:hypothetical protein CLJ1_2923 [Pseudomonas paraeruginosa]|nr:hypothetical protein CLJ1_2923 [Pseudomonas aeruginosa]